MALDRTALLHPPLTFVVYTRRPPDATLSGALIRRGHSVLERGFSAAMHQLLHDLEPHLVIACVDPEDWEDAEALRHLREAVGTSLLALVPSQSEGAMERALSAGADFCLPASLSADVIAAQADALIRHGSRHAVIHQSSSVKVHDLVIDFDRRRVVRGGKSFPLTRTEFDILGVLSRNPGRVVTASEILLALGQPVPSEAQARVIVKVHLSHLRQKLHLAGHAPYIQTIRGVGYLLEHGDSVAESYDDCAEASAVG